MTDLEHVNADEAGALQVLGPQAVLTRAGELASSLSMLIARQKLYIVVGRDRDTGEERRHVEVGGWQAAGAMFGALGGEPLHAETEWSRRVDHDELVIYESRAVIRTLDGQIVGSAESMCSSAERNWRTADEYAIRGMAETRAESRAWRRALGWVVKLAGYDSTPAEEMPVDAAVGNDEPEPTILPGWATPLGDEPVRQIAGVLVELFKTAGVDEPGRHAAMIGQAVFDACEDTMPACVGRVIWDLAAHLADPAQVLAAADSRAAEGTGGDDPDGMTYEAGSTSEGTTA